MSVEVVVVEPAESVPVAVAQAVTPDELAARLELVESRLNERIGMAESAAYEAHAQASEAQDTAEVAAVVAAVAAEQAQEQEVEPDAEDEAGEVGEGAEGDTDENDAPRPPERRAEHASKSDSGGDDQRGKKSRGYGAGWLSGGR